MSLIGGMRTLATALYAPSTLGSFLRAFTFGHVGVPGRLARVPVPSHPDRQAPLIVPETGKGFVFCDVDEIIIQVHGQHERNRRPGGVTKASHLTMRRPHRALRTLLLDLLITQSQS
jgi:hypothetical protein